jgi:hypothetical protein
MHVELAPRRREAVTPSSRRGCAGRCGGQVRPGLVVGVVDVKVLERQVWAAAERTRERRSEQSCNV